MSEHWITLEAERALYADRGRDVILCDRFPEPVTLVLKLSDGELEKLRRSCPHCGGDGLEPS